MLATGHWRLLDALGVALIVGVLGQAILASLCYLTPMLIPGGPAERTAARHRLDFAPRVRTWLLNLGVLMVALSAMVGTGLGEGSAFVTRAGWVLIAASILGQLTLMARSLLRVRPTTSTTG